MSYASEMEPDRDLGHLRVAQEALRPLLQLRYNPSQDIVEIEGIKYQGDFFRQFGHAMPLNTPMKIVAREDGVMCLVQMEPGDADWKA